MRVISINDTSNHELASKEAALALLKDRVVAYPTDTLYGLGVNALDATAVHKLFQIKQRPSTKPVPVMVSSIEMARALAYVDKAREAVLRELWPGPFTFVLWKKKVVPSNVTAGGETVALRIPAHPFCQSLLRDFEGPITTTSANISGEEPTRNAESIVERFKKENDRPDLFIHAGTLPENAPSTIVDLTTEQPKVLRVGSTTKEKLLSVLDKLSV